MPHDDLEFVRRVALGYRKERALQLLARRAALAAALRATSDVLAAIVATCNGPSNAVDHRCGATTRSLGPCRNRVALGKRCRWHELPLRPVTMPELPCSLSPL